jgi:hypothetical protein
MIQSVNPPFGYVGADGFDYVTEVVTFPHFLVLSIFLLVISRSLLKRHFAAGGFRLGLCQGCGYDLRASKSRCPECGEPVAAPKIDPGPRTIANGRHVARGAVALSAAIFIVACIETRLELKNPEVRNLRPPMGNGSVMGVPSVEDARLLVPGEGLVCLAWANHLPFYFGLSDRGHSEWSAIAVIGCLMINSVVWGFTITTASKLMFAADKRGA